MRIHDRHFAPEPDAQPAADHQPGQPDHGDQFHIVPADLVIAIAKGLEQADPGALHGDQARNHDIDQEGRHQQEYRRQDIAHGAQLVDFAGDENIGNLLVAAIGTRGAKGFEQEVELGNHRGLAGPV